MYPHPGWGKPKPGGSLWTKIPTPSTCSLPNSLTDQNDLSLGGSLSSVQLIRPWSKCQKETLNQFLRNWYPIIQPNPSFCLFCKFSNLQKQNMKKRCLSPIYTEVFQYITCLPELSQIFQGFPSCFL